PRRSHAFRQIRLRSTSCPPSAICGSFVLRCRPVHIENADHQRIDDGIAVLEPALGDRALGHEHPFADAGAQGIESDEALLAWILLLDRDFEERSRRQLFEPLRRPHLACDNSGLHGLSLTISSFTSPALSRASGVIATPLASMTRLLARPMSMTIASVSTPLSRRCVPLRV